MKGKTKAIKEKMMAKMSVKEFREYCKEMNDNQILNDEGISNILSEIKERNGFEIIFYCKKCGSSKVQIIGEDGVDYGGETGYSSGSNVIKCLECGNATTIYK